MGRKPDISSFVKGNIAALNSEGYSQRAIARRLHISLCAVQNALKSTDSSTSGRKNCHGHRKTSARDERFLKSIVTSSPTTSSARICQMAKDRGINISARTVRRRLVDDFSLVARRPAKKPLLTKAQIAARIKFSKDLVDKPTEWWHQVMFTDESTFQQVRSTGYNYVRRPVGERLNPKFTIKTVKHPPTLMVWGGITAKGRCGLHIFPKGEKVNAAKYIQVLEEKAKIHMNITGATILQQDSAPCHTAKSVKKWLTDNGIQVLENWPPNLPDLNVIENCWLSMKQKVAAHKPTSENHLADILRHVWVNEISPEYCKKLVESMPSRIRAVLENRGYPTKY